MSVKETPLAKVKRLYGGKEQLVDAVVGMIDMAGTEESPAEFKVRLMAVSNKKLLRLHESLSEVKSKYGGKEQLVKALSQAHGRAKDGDYTRKLGTYSIHRLIDMMQSAQRSSRAAS